MGAPPRHVDVQDLGAKYRPGAVFRAPLSIPYGVGYAGQEGWGKAMYFCRGDLVTSAESNPLLQAHIHHQPEFKEAEVVNDVRFYLTPPEGRLRYAVMFLSSFCTAFAASNQFRQGTKDKTIGGAYAQVGQIVEIQKPTVWVSENVEGVKWGSPSAVDDLRAASPSYHTEIVTVDSGKMVSPLTGESTATRHVRTIAIGFFKEDFATRPPLSMLKEVGEYARSFLKSLDHPEEAPEYRLMPKEDIKDIVFDFKISPTGLAYVGKVDVADVTRGAGTFPNEIASPTFGRSPWSTALGSVWIEAEVNGEATFRRERHVEKARRLGARGFDDAEGRHLLRDRGEIGGSLVGNMLPQVLPDVTAAQVLLLLSEVQKEVRTAFESWEQRSLDVGVGALTTAKQSRARPSQQQQAASLAAELNAQHTGPTTEARSGGRTRTKPPKVPEVTIKPPKVKGSEEGREAKLHHHHTGWAVGQGDPSVG